MLSSFANRQSGAALILIAFILGLGVTAYLIKTMNTITLAQQRDEKTYKALADAKAALIAWAVSHPNYPGQFPFPDRSGGGGYDGKSDCYTGTFQYSFLLGQLPIVGQSNPCIQPHTGLGGDWTDAQGNRLWYAVSRNLVHQYQSPSSNPIINPNIVNDPSYSWLKVLDRNGNLVSNRVAAVIIAPGEALPGQVRGLTAGASAFLDSFKIGAATYSNASYASSDEDFVLGEDTKSVPLSDTSFQKPYFFNDKLVYITIDELMDALQKRVGEQVKASLKAYYSANLYYPYAANFDAVSGKKYCVKNQLSGALPIDTAPTASYSCNYNRSSATDSSVSCGFDKVGAIAFTRATSSFTASAAIGQCVVSSSVTSASDHRVCTCTGAGSCSNATQKFACLANGTCTTTGVSDGGVYSISGGIFSTVAAPCIQTCSPGKTLAVSCASGTTIGTASFSYNVCTDNPLNAAASKLPAWFQTNGWQDYVYYQMTRPANVDGLSAGAKKAAAIIVTVGSAITTAPYASKAASQSQPSCSLNDYMDSVENTNMDHLFDATNTIRSQHYNDQIFLVN